MTKKNKLISLILLLVLALLAALVAGTSVSRYVFDHEDNISGSFTTLYFSHNGEGATAIMEKQEGDSYIYIGYISLTAFNHTGGHVSAREINYNVHALDSGDVKEGNTIEDEWGTPQTLSNAEAIRNSDNYSVKAEGAEGDLSLGENAPDGADPQEASRTDILTITRTGGGNSIDSTPESFYIVIEITKPYSAIYVFLVNASTSLVSVGATSVNDPGSHFGYAETEVRIQTARHYKFTYTEDNTEDNTKVVSSAPAKVTLTWDSSIAPVIFDSGRFAQSAEGNIDRLDSLPTGGNWQKGWHIESSGNVVTLTLFLPHGSDLALYFYVPQSYTCTVTAHFWDDKEYVYSAVAGVNEDGTLISV